MLSPDYLEIKVDEFNIHHHFDKQGTVFLCLPFQIYIYPI